MGRPSLHGKEMLSLISSRSVLDHRRMRTWVMDHGQTTLRTFVTGCASATRDGCRADQVPVGIPKTKLLTSPVRAGSTRECARALKAYKTPYWRKATAAATLYTRDRVNAVEFLNGDRIWSWFDRDRVKCQVIGNDIQHLIGWQVAHLGHIGFKLGSFEFAVTDDLERCIGVIIGGDGFALTGYEDHHP